MEGCPLCLREFVLVSTSSFYGGVADWEGGHHGNCWGEALKKMILSGEIQAGVPFPREWEGLSCAWPDPGLRGKGGG